MACCLMTLSHYLNKWWLIISKMGRLVLLFLVVTIVMLWWHYRRDMLSGYRVWNFLQNDILIFVTVSRMTLRCHHNGHDSVSNHQSHDCLLNRLYWRRSKKTPKLSITGLCAGNSPGSGEFPAQMASNAENVSIWWRHRDINVFSIPAGVVLSILCLECPFVDG